jgi:hypothetical protein
MPLYTSEKWPIIGSVVISVMSRETRQDVGTRFVILQRPRKRRTPSEYNEPNESDEARAWM